jgi:hypothetical protein
MSVLKTIVEGEKNCLGVFFCPLNGERIGS